MSKALYEFGGLRFWSEAQIEVREAFQAQVVAVVKRTLTEMNPAWTYHRCEGPILTPRPIISDAYGDKDIFVTNHKDWVLRAETTPSSYTYARSLQKVKMPMCVWQSGKSFRRELSEGATASKLRFNEFHQLEFQCIYNVGTLANYRAALIPAVKREIERFTMLPARVVESDRLPSYSESTMDIEIEQRPGVWREMASCSIRNDYSEQTRVCEIAIGLCRIASIISEGNDRAS